APPPVPTPPAPAAPATASRPLVAGFTGPTDDHGMVVEPVIQIQDDADILSDRLRKAGYQVVRDVEANGEVFEAAAHKPDGRRILVKRVPKLDETLAASLAQLSRDLSADVCMVLAGAVAPGTRLATFGTPVVALAPGEARGLAL
ncbi:MAG TPA: hypothetical protein VM889_04840, partial [Candidatus Thermoplasmatota archaeon]|nr:hypothetical protein [Candidatus Thermoplasmatota archaeon]